MKVIDTSLNDVKVIQPTVFGDERGFLFESFRDNWFKKSVADVNFVQDNHSMSTHGILRGLHYQTQMAQGKLVRVVEGEVFDVAVDMRQSSSTFGQAFGVLLSTANKKQLWIPAGFAHGFYVISQRAQFAYKCTQYYAPEFEKSVLWNDSRLNIQWPLVNGAAPKLSEKDKAGSAFNESFYFE